MGGLRAFRTILDFELHLLAFPERLVTLHLDGGIMREHVVAALGRGNEEGVKGDILLFLPVIRY